LNILLLFSPYSYEGQPRPKAFPLGLGYIGAMLRLHGFHPEIADLSIRTPNYAQLSNLIRSCDPDIIGISAMTENHLEALRIARLARETVEKAVIVMGGPHATFKYTDLLLKCPEIDVVVVGEGEKTMLELAETVDKGLGLSQIGHINGLAFRRGDDILLTPSREKISDLDELPYPAFDLLVHPKLEDYFEDDIKALPVLTSRGCPYHCAFCSTSVMHGKKYRVRSPKNVVDEIEYDIENYGVNRVVFVDDIFTLDQVRTKEICSEIIRRNINITWCCSTRVDCVNPELLKIMKQAGCTGIFYGIESLSDAVLKKVKKGFTSKKVRQAVNWTLEEGLDIDASFILGLPGETSESLRLIPEFIRQTGLSDRIIANMLQLLPGTEMYSQPQKFGLKVSENEFSHWMDLRSYIEGIGIRDLVETLLEMKLAFHENRFQDDRLFEVSKPEIEIIDECTVFEIAKLTRKDGNH